MLAKTGLKIWRHPVWWPVMAALVLSFIAVPSHAGKLRIAKERASKQFTKQIRVAMDDLLVLDAAFARLGYPTEEKRILGRTFVIWRRVGPEVKKISSTTLMQSWGNSSTRSEFQSRTEHDPSFFGGGTSDTIGSGKSSSKSFRRGDSSTSGRSVKHKIQCTITLEVDEQKRVKGWQFERDSDLSYCETMLNIRPSFNELVDAELARFKRDKEYWKAAKEESKTAARKVEIGILGNCGALSISKVAIFPFGSDDNSCQGRSRGTDEQIASTIQSSSPLVTYSYYDNPTQNSIGRVWADESRGSINGDIIRTVGQQIGVDAVLMAWRPSAGTGYCTSRMPPFPITLYLVDVKSQCALFAEGDESYITEIVGQLFNWGK